MNNFDRVSEMVDEYVKLNGTSTEMDRNEFIGWVHEKYENISVEKNNLYPTDISYNLYNAGLKDFPGPNLCLVYVEERETFRLVGTGYKHTGPIWQYKGKSNETVVGMWNDGVCKMGTAAVEDSQLPENILYRRDDLFGGVKGALKSIPVTVATERSAVTVKFQELLICGINVEDEEYKIYNVSSGWVKQTSYLCEESGDGTWHYYLETIDECIGEIGRLVSFEKSNIPQAENDIDDCRLDAAEWIDSEKRKGNITYFMTRRGRSRQKILTPGLKEILDRLDVPTDSENQDYPMCYEIEMKNSNEKNAFKFKIVFHQTIDTPETVLDFFRQVATEKMGRKFKESAEWYVKTIVSESLKDVTRDDILSYLERGLRETVYFEKSLLESSYWNEHV